MPTVSSELSELAVQVRSLLARGEYSAAVQKVQAWREDYDGGNVPRSSADVQVICDCLNDLLAFARACRSQQADELSRVSTHRMYEATFYTQTTASWNCQG